MTIMKIIDGLYFTIGMILFNPLTGESKTPDQLNEDDRATYDACMGAIALLKAQEPRLVEPNDFENADDYNWLPAWCEERTGAAYWEMILPDALDEKDVRYWTSRPTDEQREAVKWNG